MRPRSLKSANFLVALVAGACFASSARPAAEASTTAASKRTTPPGPTLKTHTATKKTLRKTQRAVSATKKRTQTSTSTAVRNRSAQPAKATITHHQSANGARTAGSASKTAISHKAKAGGKSHHALNARQRLARIHLEPSRVQEIQQALSREGYLHAESTGQWDEQTRAAMLRYQTDHGFSPTGLPDAKSLMKLGLGPHPLPPELDTDFAHAASASSPKGDAAVASAPPASEGDPPPETK